MLAKVNNNVLLKYPYTKADLEQENPHTDYSNINVEEVYPLTEEAAKTGNTLVHVRVSNKPTYSIGEKLVETQPCLIDGNWVVEWEILPDEDFTEEDLLNHVNNKITNLLVESEWSQKPDSDLTEAMKLKFQQYRNALENMPNVPGFPNIEFPVYPEDIIKTSEIPKII